MIVISLIPISDFQNSTPFHHINFEEMASYTVRPAPNKKKEQPPETIVGEEGSAKRNILRKGGAGVYRKEKVSGASVDDGEYLQTFNLSTNVSI